MGIVSEDASTFLIKSSKNRSFGTGFCIYKDSNGSYLLTAAHVVESCGIENLLIESFPAKLLHISQENNSLDLALVYVEGLLNTTTLKLCQEKAIVGETFDIVGYRPHKKDHAKEPLKGYIKKAYTLESEEKRDIYELRINDDDSIEQGYSGSAVVSTVTGLVIAIATDRKTNGKQAYATPAYYLKEIWQEMPKDFFESFTNTNPYKGLNSFEYEDRENYYGREEESQEIASILKTTKLFTLLGASGSGKSSLIFAGVLPIIKSDEVEVLSFRPLDEPFKNLASVFIPILYTDKLEQLRKEKELAYDLFKNDITLTQLVEMLLEQKSVKHLYLIIDQFEELFTLTEESSSKNSFLEQLLLLINSDLGVTLFLSMRADFLSHISYYDSFNKAYNTHPSQMLSLLRREKLRRVIELPAKKMGVEFQEGLVERIIEEIEDEAGQLPLLEFALEQFWVNKKGRIISHVVLDEMQSISHSISHYADRVYERNPTYHASIKKVLIKLVNPGSGKEDTRRIASFDEFDKEARKTITLLANERLIVTEDGNIDIVHEALIREWQRLEKWINDYRDFLEWEKHLRDDRKFYVKNGSKKEDLLVESKLLRAKEFFQSHEDYIAPLNKSFVEESINVDKAKKKKKVIWLSLSFIVLFGVIAVVVFFWKDTQEKQKETQNMLYKSVVEQGIIARNYLFRPLKSKLTFADAIYNSGDETQLNHAKLLYYFNSMKNFELMKVENEKSMDQVINIYTQKILTKNKKIITWKLGEKSIRVFDNKDTNVSKIISTNEEVFQVVLSHDEKKIAWCTLNTVNVWDLVSSKLILSLESKTIMLNGQEYEHPDKYFNPEGVRFTQNDENILIWGSNIFRLYNANDGRLLKKYKGIYDFSDARLSKDEKKILAWGLTDIVLYDIDKEEPIQSFEYSSNRNYLKRAVFNHHETKILAWGDDRIVNVFDIFGFQTRTLRHQGHVKEAKFNKKSTKILSWDNEGNLNLWNTQRDKPLLTLKHKYGVRNAVFDENETKILSSDYNNTIRHWNMVDYKLITSFKIPKNIELVDEFTANTIEGILVQKEEKNIFFWLTDTGVYLWNRHNNKKNLLFKHNNYIKNITSKNSKILSWSYSGKTLKLWEKNKRLLTFKHDSPILGAILNENATKILSWDNQNIKLWSINNKTPLVSLKHNRYVSKAILMKNEQSILYVDSDIKLYSIKDKTILFTIKNKEGVKKIVLSKDEKKIIALNYDNTVIVWNIDNLTNPLLTVPYKYEVSGAVFNKYENQVISWAGSSITLNNLDTREFLVLENEVDVTGIQLNANETKLLSWGRNKIIKLWDIENVKVLHTFRHEHGINKAILSENEDKILSLDWEGTMILWSVSLEVPLIILKKIKDAHFSNNGKEIVVFSDSVIKIYNIDPNSYIDKKHYPLKTQVETGVYLTSSGEVKALTKKEWEAKKVKYEKILAESKD